MSTSKPVQKILRIGLFQNGEFIEERLIHSRGSVTIGQDFKKNTFVVPGSELPKSMTVFESKDGHYTLHFDSKTAVKLSVGDGSKSTSELVQSGIAKKGASDYEVSLNDRAYGRIAWGTGSEEVALLFQFVTPPPPRPKPVLPASMRGGIVTGILGSLILAITCSISAVLQIGFVAFLLANDWPKPRDIEYELPDRFVKIMVEEEEDIELSDEKMEIPTEEGPGEEEQPSEEPAEEAEEKAPETPEERAAAEAERKRRMAEEVQNKTILGVIGSVSDGASLMDTLAEGAGATSMEEAFANSQGVKAGVAGEKSGLVTSGSSSADGKGKSVGIGDLRGTKGASAAKSGVDTGDKGEKKVKVRLRYEKEKVIGTGKLDANAISQVIKRRQSAIQSCYEREIKKNPKASGKVIVTFTIGTAGRVTQSKASQDSVGGGVGNCVASTIERMRFPRPEGGEVIVNKTFVFEVAQ